MRQRILWALVALNVFLAVVFVARATGEKPAMGQVRRSADYLMIPGEVTVGNMDAVYILDMTNGELGAITYDDANKVIDTMVPINLAQVFNAGMGNRPRGR